MDSFDDAFPWVSILYTLSAYNFLLAVGAGLIKETQWATVFGEMAGLAWVLASLIETRSRE